MFSMFDHQRCLLKALALSAQLLHHQIYPKGRIDFREFLVLEMDIIEAAVIEVPAVPSNTIFRVDIYFDRLQVGVFELFPTVLYVSWRLL